MDLSTNDTTLNQSSTNSELSDVHEKEIEYLRTQLMRINNYSTILNSQEYKFDPTFSQWRLANKLLDNNEECQVFQHRLKQEFLRINSLISEANTILHEIQQEVTYSIILQMPVSYLKPNDRAINNLCELAIQVKRENFLPQIWTIEKFEFKLNTMKDIYHQWELSENKTDLLTKEFKRNNPFFDEESDSLIGVANIYLKALFYNSKLDYIVPIINTQGEMSGSLHVVLDQTGPSSMKKLNDLQINSTARGSMSEGISIDIDEQSLSNHSNSQQSLEDEGIGHSSALTNGKNDQITIKFAIKTARDLPQSDCENVMCRYTFINPKLDQTIHSLKTSDDNPEQNSRVFSFNHENEYTFPISENFLSTCFESAISIEVWYEKLQSKMHTESYSEVHELSKRWKDVKRHIQYSVEIHELDASGQWGPVEVDCQEQFISGGVYRLKQGQSKRLVTQVRILPRPDPMPLVLHTIRSVEIGSISTRKIDAPRQLDSYQDEELQHLKSEWLNLIEKRKIYLESQVNELNQQTNKTVNDSRKEKRLIEELVRLAEERNIVAFPPSSSGIPGAPAAWSPPRTIEIHRPMIFLNLDSINTNPSNASAGHQAILNEENKTKMFPLPLMHHASEEIRAVAQWDPSIHESTAMNQVTPNDTLIYLIVKIVVIVSQPIHMELVLRKRIAVTISKTEGWWSGKTIKNFLGYKPYKGTSVVYEIVSSIPKPIYNNEDQEQNVSEYLSEDFIQKYIQCASIVDSLLLLDNLRQGVLLAENSAKQQVIRKSTSAPNITPQKRNRNEFNSTRNSRRENIRDEIIPSSSESELYSSTPSMISRAMVIEEQQIEPVQRPVFEIKRQIDLDDDTEQNQNKTLEEKYPVTPKQCIELSTEQTTDNNTEDYSIGSRVIVNTGHSVFNKPGIIRYSGEIFTKKGIWYGIELEEPVGKNNGSFDGHSYFQCRDKHGVFVRYEKIRLVNSN